MTVDVDDALASRRLGQARAIFGALFLLRTTPLLWPLEIGFLRGARPLLGWPDSHLHIPVTAALALPAFAVAALCVVRTAAALALCLGYRSRVAGIASGISGHLVLAQDAFGHLQTLHLLYLGSILFALTDADSAFALRPLPPRHARSGLRLMRIFVASIYAWAALAKLRADWLDGRTLGLFFQDGLLRGPFASVVLATPLRRRAIAVMVFTCEALLGPSLLFARTRKAAALIALSLHAAIQLSGGADFFGFEMAALLLLFL